MKRERLDDFTERAIRSTDAGKLIPPIVYLPRRLRGQKVRLTEDNLRYTVDPPTVTETHVAIAGADPVGFLIAIMHGQPIPEFRIARDGAIDVFYAVPEFETRTRAARFLAEKQLLNRTLSKAWRGNPDAQREYDAMIARGAAPALDADNTDTETAREAD
jgi:hypothetical protein